MTDDEKKSKIALGICVICAIAGMETYFADARAPNPLSPIVWAVLGGVGALSLVASLWFRARAKRQR
jgi:hypothetical protein